MARLARLRFVNVGHEDARIDDLTLNFRDNTGRAVDSTIWLRNGGGKSSLLNLFFSLVQPSRRQFLGGKADYGDRQLEEYVDRNDHAVVIAEWELPGDPMALAQGLLLPERYLTGVFYEWKPGRNGEDAKLDRLFFAARVDERIPELTIEGLPLFAPGATGATGRRVMASFKAEWLALRGQAPHANVGTYEKNKDWEEVLDHIGLDPDLFRYQVRMNVQEGGADQLFSFGAVEEFVDFFLELVLDPTVGDQVTTNIVTFRDDLRRRAHELVPERALVDALVLRLEPLRGVATQRARLRETARDLRRDLWHLEQHGDRRAATVGTDIALQQQTVEEAQGEARRLRTTADQQRRRAVACRRHAAEVSLKHAEAAYEAARKRHTTAQREQRIWEAAVPLRDALRHEQSVRDLERDLARIQAQHAPLLADVREAANAYADAMRARLATLASQEGALRAQQTEHQQNASAAGERALEAQRRATSAQARVEAAERAVEAEHHSREVLTRVGALQPGESPVAASERWARERDAAFEEATAHGEFARLATAGAQQHEERAATCRAALATLDATLASERALVEDAEQAMGRLATHQLLARTLELDPAMVDVRALGADAVRQLRETAHAYLQREVDDRIGREVDERARLALEATELLPPRRDVERVLAAVADLRAGVWSGWTYLSANPPAGGMRAFLRVAPAVADGIVVRDADYARVVERLTASDLQRLDAPVLVIPQGAIAGWTAATPPTVGTVVGPSSDAFFSSAAGQRELEARRQRLATAQRRIEEARQARVDLEELALSLERFVGQYPATWWAERRRSIAETEGQIAVQQMAQSTAKTEAAAAHRAAGEAEERRRLAEGRANTADRQRDRIDGHLRLHPQGDVPYEKDRAEALSDVEQAEAERDTASEEAATLRGYAQELGRRLEGVAGDQRAAEADLHRIQHTDPARTTAIAGDVEALRARYTHQFGRYTQAIGADTTQALLELALDEAKKARDQFARKLKDGSKDGVTEPDVVAALEALADRSLADDRRSEAIEDTKSAWGLFGNQGQAVNLARETVKSARQACTAIGTVPLLSDEELHRAPALLEQQAVGLEREAAAAQKSAEEFDGIADLAEQEIATLTLKRQEILSSLQMILAAWNAYGTLFSQLAPESPTPGETKRAALLEPFEAPSTDAICAEAVRHTQAALARLRSDGEALDGERQRIVKEVQGLLTAPAYENVKGPLVADLRRWDAAEFEERIDDVTRELALRLTYITSLMEQADRHRNTLIDGALHATEEAVRLLGDAGRQSKVPAHVPGIGGSHFLKVSFKVPDDVAERRLRLGRLIDELAEREDAIPKGLAFVQRCVQQLAHPISVKVLFPDPDREPDYRDVTKIGKFSTGQRLTCATLLYLTLANLRARVRWRRAAPTGVLVCDNPFGKASRTSFIEMQREVARCGGIQLIYTTGINDYEALAMLPNVIRLENSRQDRRTGERVLELASVQAGAGKAKRSIFPPGSIGVLDAVRIGRTVLPTTAVRGTGSAVDGAIDSTIDRAVGSGAESASVTTLPVAKVPNTASGGPA